MSRRKWLSIVGVLLLVVVICAAVHRFSIAELMDLFPLGKNASAATVPSVKSGHAQLWTCGMHPQVIQDHPGNCPICHMKLTPLVDSEDNAVAATSPAGPAVRIDPTVVQNMGVTSAPVTRGPLDVTLRVVGMINPPEAGMHDVTLRIGGYIEKLYANTDGMRIEKGDVLFDLYSPEIQLAGDELITAVKLLKAAGSETNADLKKESATLVESAKQKLRLWGLAEREIEAIAAADRVPRTLPFRSTAEGHLIEKAVVEGSAVQAGMKLMRIEDHSKLWLDAQVYEAQLPWVALGADVTATVDGVANKTWTGKVSFIHPHLDHMTRTEVVRTEIDNPDHLLRPGMYAMVSITTHPVADAVLVPREAVIDTGVKQFAFVADPATPGPPGPPGGGRFQPRNVRMGLMGNDGKVQILEGLAPGEQVVTSGQFLMDVESRTTEAIQKLRKMNSNDATTKPSSQMSVAHCPMKDADWLQIGDAIANPYFGSDMSTCGDITGKLNPPAKGSPLEAVANAYLKVAKGLNADRLDADTLLELKHAAESLRGERDAALHAAIDKLVASKQLDAAREAFKAASGELIKALSEGVKP